MSDIAGIWFDSFLDILFVPMPQTESKSMHDMLFVLRRTIKDEKEPVLIFCASQV